MIDSSATVQAEETAKTMRAIVRTNYGSPDVLQVKEVENQFRTMFVESW